MAETAIAIERLPLEPKTELASGWWGMILLIVTEAALFSLLEFSYYYLFSQSKLAWPPEGPLPLRLALPNTLVLILSSVAVFGAERAVRRGNSAALCSRLLLGIALGVVFVGLQITEWLNKPFNPTSHAFGSLYYVITGFHMAHVAVGLIMLAAVMVWSYRGYYGADSHLQVTTTSYYWHFVDVVWITVFFAFYLWPILI